MLNVTEKAQEQVAKYFEDNTVKPIRVFLANGCGGQQIALALDETKPNDEIFEFAGIQYIVDKHFLSQAQPIEIDFATNGFKIASAMQLSSGCSGCGTSSNCCS